jgi:hypothetical protein
MTAELRKNLTRTLNKPWRRIMPLKLKGASRLLAVCVLATLSLVVVAKAQPNGPGRAGPGASGYMMGPGMMGRHQFEHMCSPRTLGFAEWRIDRLEKVVKPTEAQRAKFDEFKAASNKATEAMRAACPTDVPTTMVGRMEAMEKRLDAMLQAVKTVRPALDAFYATLSDEQKASLNAGWDHKRFWHWRDRW